MQSPRISRLLSALAPSSVEDFWAETCARGTPLIEPCDDESVLVTFLWRGEAASTRAWWGVDVPLRRAPGTDLWHGTERLPASVRTIYCLAHEDAEHAPRDETGAGDTHVDAANPERLYFPADPADPDDRDSWLSLLELPAAPPEPWSRTRPGVPAGTVTELTLPGAALGRPRPVALYRPAGTPTDGLPVLVVFDGFLARHVLRVPTVLDNLIAAGAIPPMAALFVGTYETSRERDLAPARPIHEFVEHELMPWARTTLGAGRDRRGNLIAGVSRGGLAAAYVGMCAHELFGGVIAQSGSFWWPSPAEGAPRWLIRQVTRYPRVDVRFYLDVGLRETMPGPGGAPSQLSVVREMRDTLVGHGYEVAYAEYSGGHDYVNWRRTFADGLIAVARA
ncbi:alpha/beta hydrolase [Paractinoplanes globisporus]|uniref:Alpha/beta hydrolase n=1 Tax=Paractinoplanes globisporus TaxID=113565 RepID=A0ABW6WS29_9ACTN|nr:alpha/beta hydrolase-fold protein [Actinoplanes globisporus]